MSKIDYELVKVFRDGEEDQDGYVAIINDKELRKDFEEGGADYWDEIPDDMNIVLFIANSTDRNEFYATYDTCGYECWNGDIIKKAREYE